MDNNSLIKIQNELVNHVSNPVNITSKLLGLKYRDLSILHLDDHILYSAGVSNVILKKYPNAAITKIQNGQEALNYVIDHLANNKSLDLIITDINHMGLDGIRFSIAVRQAEKNYNRIIPILVISMIDDKQILSKIECLPLTKCLSKCVSGEEIYLAINNFT